VTSVIGLLLKGVAVAALAALAMAAAVAVVVKDRRLEIFKNKEEPKGNEYLEKFTATL